MARVLIVGAGMGGLSTAIMLARDGHAVTVVERDPARSPGPERTDEAWERWDRRGVNQFRLPHFMQPQWWSHVCAEIPEARGPLEAAGTLRANMVEMLPESVRGPVRPDDTRFDIVTGRRPVLEAALSAAADAVGVEVRRGVTVTGLDTREGTGVPHVTGVTTADGTLAADLVVDCAGRRSKVGEWLVAVGARPPVEERLDSGYVYYGRHFRSPAGPPVALSWVHQFYPSLSILTLPSDNDTWSVVFIVSGRDKELRGLHDADRWTAALTLYPTVAHWTDGEPITGIDALAGIEDRFRRLSVDGQPVATGVVVVGDSWACTNPSLGRGATIALIHARVLRDVLRHVDADDHARLARRFDQATTEVVEPMYRATRWFDGHRLAEIDADIAGVPYETDDVRWRMATALATAAAREPELARSFLALGGMVATPDEIFAQPGVADRVIAAGMPGPRYVQPGPDRATLLKTVA